MKRVSLPPKRIASKSLGRMLVLFFGLTIASFLSSRWVSEYRARGIDAAASSIADVSSPAIEHLSKARTELRHMDALLTDLVSRSSSGLDVDAARKGLEASRREFEDEWKAYLKLPPYPGERELWGVATDEHVAMNSSIDTVLRLVHGGDVKGADVEREYRTAPSFDRMDAELRRGININADNAAQLGRHIEEIRSKVRVWGLVADTLSLLFGASAIFLLLRMVRRFTQLMDLRVSELELFAGRVAHDIRSPLSAVSFVLDTAKRSPQVEPKMADMLDRGIRSLQRVAQVVDALLVFARSGGSRLGDAHANVKDIISDIVEDMRPAAEEKGIDLRYDQQGPSSIVACSPGVLVSIVSNLVGNAIKYMGDAPVKRVMVRSSTKGRNVRVEVRDTGPGVPPELRERVFDPYVRAASASIPGMGLGLATVKRLTEGHGGTVGLEPNVRVGGSVFWFQLPLAPEGDPEVSAASIAPTEQAHMSR